MADSLRVGRLAAGCAAFCFLLWIASEGALGQGEPIGDFGEILRDIEFGKGGGLSMKLDLCRPKDRPKGLMPAIVWFHGGGWYGGNKVMVGPAKPEVLLRRGYCLISADYRLSGQAKFPAAVEDCKCAVRWVRKHAQEYGIDPSRIAAMGYSAGGHLALMVGCAQDKPELEGKGGNESVSSRVQAVCSLSGPTDLTAFKAGSEGEKAARDLCGGTLAEKPDVYKQASPVTYAAKDNPPILMIHGELDGTVPVVQADSMARTLKEAGAKVTYIRVKNYTHSNAQGKQEPSAEVVQKAILDFLDAALTTPRK